MKKLYHDLQGALKAGYSKSGNGFAPEYQSWAIFNTQPYVSQTHGKRYVNNYANDAAKAAYAKFEKIGKMPVGGVLAKDSFVVKDGKAQPGPLFLMEKMAAGFNAASDDWRYTLIMPDGTVFGTTNGANSKKVEFCVQCHKAVADQDSLYFLDEKYRAAP
ncbi:MAG: cytochrome P460 family protein [Rhodospirillales bacterium]|nr:cytochrome P460 family protein [Rhodospirillales bacterium]